MKYARFTILIGVLAAVLIAACMLAAAQAQWKVVIPQKNVGDKFRVAAFHSESFGFAGGAGDVGKAHYTSDGGQTWATADTSGG